MVVDNHIGIVAIHNLQSLVAQVLGKLDIDQNQFELVNQVQTEVGTVGIGVVGIVATMVVKTTVVAQ